MAQRSQPQRQQANQQSTAQPQQPAKGKFESWLETLSAGVRNLLAAQQSLPQSPTSRADTARRRLAASDSGYRSLTNVVSARARAALESAAAPDESGAPAGYAPGYYAVFQDEGDWPVVRGYGSLAQLQRSIAAADGNDTTCVPFYGVPLAFTRKVEKGDDDPAGRPRVLILPDHSGVLLASPFSAMETLYPDYDVDENWFLGPPELSMVVAAGKGKSKGKKGKAADDAPGDEDDDEDKGSGVEA